MKVLYDHQTFSLQDYGGISKIFAELLENTDKYNWEAELSALFSNNIYLKDLDNFKTSSFYKNINWKYKQRLLYEINKWYSIKKLKSSKFNIFHPTYYDPYFLNYLDGRPFVITYHDLTHEYLSDKYIELRSDNLIINGKRTLVNYAEKIIAVSQSTKNDIVKFYNVAESKIEVIYLASSFKILREGKGSTSSEKYILFVGNRGLYKNFLFFLKSISALLKKNKNLKLICGGGGKFTHDEIDCINNLNLRNQVQQLAINKDVTLQDLYTNALCFVFPSLYEGFGIPLLEAFSCGCAVAASNTSSLPEVGGDAVVYFDPEDSESIAVTVNQLIHDKELRTELISKGYKRVADFSWSKTTKLTFDLYTSVIRR